MFISAHVLVACGPPPDADDDVADVDAGGVDAAIDAPMPRLTELWPADEQERAGFGRAMAKSADTIVVGALQAPERTPGAAYVFVRRDGEWRQQAKLTGDAGAVAFAEGVAIGGDTIAVTERMPGATMGASTTGRVRVYTRSGETWSPAQTLELATPSSGYGQSIAVQGDTIVVGDRGRYEMNARVDMGARVYVRDGATWTERATLLPPPHLTASWSFASAITLDGDHLAVSDPYAINTRNETSGHVYMYERDGAGAWQFRSTVDPDFGNVWPSAIGFGDSLALAGNRLVVGVSRANCPTARVYERDDLTWRLVAKLDPNHNACGTQTARVALDGDRVAIGATGAYNDTPLFRIDGAGYVFEKTSAGWSEMPVTTVRPRDAISAGTAILLDGETLFTGAPGSATVYVWGR